MLRGTALEVFLEQSNQASQKAAAHRMVLAALFPLD